MIHRRFESHYLHVTEVQRKSEVTSGVRKETDPYVVSSASIKNPIIPC